MREGGTSGDQKSGRTKRRRMMPMRMQPTRSSGARPCCARLSPHEPTHDRTCTFGYFVCVLFRRTHNIGWLRCAHCCDPEPQPASPPIRTARAPLLSF
jgi:hypothetical protein